MHQQMKEAERDWKRNRTEAVQEKKDRLTQSFRTLAQEKKQTAFQTFCTSLGNESMWSGIQRLTGSKRSARIDLLRTPHRTLTEPEDIANALAEKYFISSSDPRPQSYQQKCTMAHQRSTETLPFLEEDYEPFETAEVELALESGKSLAAPGYDALPNLVYKKLSAVLASPVADIFNACLELGYFPASFKIANVVSVPKAGKDPLSNAGYRPIALLSTLGKKLESLLCRRFVDHIESQKAWSKHQYGFRRRKSTTQALTRFLDKAATALNNRYQLIAVSFDLQAAFDSTHPDILWQKLQDSALPRHLLRLLDGFCRQREARLILGPDQWSFFPTRGLPQGSPLSPVLFLTYANGLLQTLTGSVEGQLYADDLILWKELRADGTDATDLQLTLRKLERWADQHEMTFNATKTQTVDIARIRKKVCPTLRFQNYQLSPQPSIRYLGIHIDRRLLLTQHIQSIQASALRRLSSMKMIASPFFGSKPTTLRQLVKGAILPLLTYGIEAWGFRLHVQSLRLKLNRIIRLCSLWITGAYPSAPALETRHLAGLETIEDRYHELLLRSAYHLPRESLEPLLEERSTMVRSRSYLASRHELAIELLERTQRGLKPPGKHPVYADWKDAIRSQQQKAQDQNWQQSQPSSGRRKLQWGPFWPRPKWPFRHLKRTQLSLLCQFLLAHWPARTHMHRINKAEDKTCRLCGLQEEDQEHIFNCPCLVEEHRQLRGNPRSLGDITRLLKNKNFLTSLTSFLGKTYRKWGLTHVFD